jgi:hypothetical protein
MEDEYNDFDAMAEDVMFPSLSVEDIEMEYIDDGSID